MRQSKRCEFTVAQIHKHLAYVNIVLCLAQISDSK